MSTQPLPQPGPIPLALIRQESTGQFTAQLVGPSELRATAGTREEALAQLRGLLRQALASGQLVPLDLPREDLVRPWDEWAASDPEYNLYREEIRRYRQQQDELLLKEGERPACPSSTWTPTT